MRGQRTIRPRERSNGKQRRHGARRQQRDLKQPCDKAERARTTGVTGYRPCAGPAATARKYVASSPLIRSRPRYFRKESSVRGQQTLRPRERSNGKQPNHGARRQQRDSERPCDRAERARNTGVIGHRQWAERAATARKYVASSRLIRRQRYFGKGVKRAWPADHTSPREVQRKATAPRSPKAAA